MEFSPTAEATGLGAQWGGTRVRAGPRQNTSKGAKPFFCLWTSVMDLPRFGWQEPKVSIRRECWGLSFNLRSTCSPCSVYIRLVLCCASQITSFPNMQIGNVDLQKGACARPPGLLREKERGAPLL